MPILATAIGSTGCGSQEQTSKGPITVASMIDSEGAVLGNMILIILQENGFDTVDKLKIGTPDIQRKAIIADEVDIIIDVTGAPKVRETLRKYMVDTGNDHTLIMHERIALLMLSLSAGQLLTGKHDKLEYN